MEASLNIGTLNVRGLATRKKQGQVHRLLTERGLDVLAIQETKIDGEEETASMVDRFTLRYYACVSHAIGSSAGCVVFVKKMPGLEVQAVKSYDSGRLVVCDFLYGVLLWRILCVYAPNKADDRNEFFANLRHLLTTERLVILMGDFNCVLSSRDKSSSSPYRDASTDLLTELVQDASIVDIAECLEGARDVQYTHFQGSSHARLDRIYVSLDLIGKCERYSVLPVSFSDHCLVQCNIGRKIYKAPFNWDLWKLNTKLLKDEVFASYTTEKLNEFQIDEDNLIFQKWEVCKGDIKMKAIERSCCLRYEEKIKEMTLRTNLKKLTTLESRMPGVFKDDIRQTKQKIELIDQDRYRGALVRARAEHWASGETPTKRALGMEKAHAKRNHIDEINWKGRTTSDTHEIESAFFEYYQALFAFQAADIEGFRKDFLGSMPRLEDDVKLALEEPISHDEVKTAIEDLNPGKSPGPDGLSAAFYKENKHLLVPILANMFNMALEKKTLPPSCSTSHTVLIPKTEDTEKLKSVASYRPISLTNVDYKVFMKILARRLQTVMEELVGPHQTCGIKGRTIFSNIHKARCVLECCDATDTGVAMLQLDLEKAFDCVSHELLFLVLEHVNVGRVISQGVALAYQKCTTQLIVNKNLGAPICVQRSVRQGCPLSPLLFGIYIEALCQSIIRNNGITGYQLQATEVKLLAYADDVAVFCTDKQSISLAVQTVKRFGDVTGSRVNWGKCVGFWHGAWLSTPSTFENVSWVTTPVKYLGTPLENYRDSDPYWRCQINDLKERTQKWKGAWLSVFAKATVCNVFLVAKIWYVMQTLHCSRVNVQKLHRVFAVFVWSSTWERCSRTNLFRRVRDGGLGLVHLYVRQLVNRFIFLRDTSDPFLRTVIHVRLARALPAFVVSSRSMSGGIHGYLKEVVMSFQFLIARFSLEYLSTVSRKKLYKDVCDSVFPVPLYRALYCGGPGQNVLKRVKRMEVNPCVKSFFFKLHTGTLSVRTWMQERGLFVPWGVNCSICKQPENIEHVFLHCWAAVFLWDVLQRTIHKDFPLHPHGIRFLSVDNEEGVPYDVLMLLGLHSIWRSRMAWLHGDVDARPTRQYFIESITEFVEVQKSKDCLPEWLSRVEPLTALKEF